MLAPGVLGRERRCVGGWRCGRIHRFSFSGLLSCSWCGIWPEWLGLAWVDLVLVFFASVVDGATLFFGILVEGPLREGGY